MCRKTSASMDPAANASSAGCCTCLLFVVLGASCSGMSGSIAAGASEMSVVASRAFVTLFMMKEPLERELRSRAS